MKLLIAAFLILPFTSFAQDISPNIGGTYYRLESTTCKGAYRLSKTKIETATKEIESTCSQITDVFSYEDCTRKIYVKHGERLDSAELIITANESSEDEIDETFTIRILNKGAELYNKKNSGYYAKGSASNERALQFEEYDVNASNLFIQTGNFNNSNMESAIGASVILDILSENTQLYQFVNNCSFNWAQ